jgi:hypothetical protein
MHGMPMLEQLVEAPAAELPHASPAGSPAVRAGYRQRDRQPHPGIFLVPEVAGERGGRPAREPALHEGGAGSRALVRVVRLQAAALRAELTGASSSQHGQPVSSAFGRERGISADQLAV